MTSRTDLTSPPPALVQRIKALIEAEDVTLHESVYEAVAALSAPRADAPGDLVQLVLDYQGWCGKRAVASTLKQAATVVDAELHLQEIHQALLAWQPPAASGPPAAPPAPNVGPALVSVGPTGDNVGLLARRLAVAEAAVSDFEALFREWDHEEDLRRIAADILRDYSATLADGQAVMVPVDRDDLLATFCDLQVHAKAGVLCEALRWRVRQSTDKWIRLLNPAWGAANPPNSEGSLEARGEARSTRPDAGQESLKNALDPVAVVAPSAPPQDAETEGT